MNFKMPMITDKSLLDVLLSRTDFNTASCIANIATAMLNPDSIMIQYNDIEGKIALGNILLNLGLHKPSDYLTASEYKEVKFNLSRTDRHFNKYVIKVDLSKLFDQRNHKIVFFSYNGLVKYCENINQNMQFLEQIKLIVKDYNSAIANQKVFNELV